MLLVLCVTAAILAPWIVPQDPYDLAKLDILDARLPPGSLSGDGAMHYRLGTDSQGRDMLSAIVYGLRISVAIGVASTVFAAIVGIALGLVAGYRGGRVDALIMRIADLQLSFPSILIALILLAFLRPGVGNIVAALVAVQWAYYARTVRGTALVERQKEYIEAARGLGLSTTRIVFRHLLPNCLPPLVVVATLADRVGDRARGDAVVPRARRADHRAVARPADRERLPGPVRGPVLDQRLPRPRAGRADRRAEPRRRSPARPARSEAEVAMTAATRPLLEVVGLKTHFALPSGIVKAVDGVDLSVARGEVLGIVGESGSGKSVTGLSILRMIDPPGRIVDGRIAFDGIDLLALDREAMRRLRGDRIAMIFQDPMMTLNPVLSIGTQMIETLVAHPHTPPLSKAAMRERAVAALDRVGIASPAERLAAYPHQLSGGMRQRVAIAIALLNDPDLIICDEPTTALDVTIQARILDTMQDLIRTSRLALIWITHDLTVVAGLADRVAVMYGGRVVESGTTAQIIGTPRHPYTRGLIDSTPAAARSAAPSGSRRLRQIPGSPPSLAHLPVGCPFHPRCFNAQDDCLVDPPNVTDATGRTLRCFHPVAYAP